MGRILIHPPNQKSGAAESPLPDVLQTPSGLALLEVQGTLNSTDANTDGEGKQTALKIGSLSFPLYDPSNSSGDIAWQSRVHLYVGENQRLTGTLKKLPNPMAVIQRRPSDGDNEDLEVVDIIYYKLMFTHRPEPFGTTVSA